MFPKKILLVIPFLTIGYITAVCLSTDGSGGLLIVVKSKDGKPLAEVRVFDRANGDLRTKSDGTYQTSRPGKVIFLHKPGYRPHVLLTEKLSGRVEVALEDASFSEWRISSCGKEEKLKKLILGNLVVSVLDRAEINLSDDIDYASRAVFYDSGKKERLDWIHGPHATGGFPPDKWIVSSSEFAIRSCRFDGSEGIDIRGRSIEGKYWRFFGIFGTVISYHDASTDASAFFDRILDSVCFQKPF